MTLTGMLFPDHNKARKDLETFAMLNEARLYKLLKGCVDPQSDLRTIVKSQVSATSDWQEGPSFELIW